jgi:hypothetical protein
MITDEAFEEISFLKVQREVPGMSVNMLNEDLRITLPIVRRSLAVNHGGCVI